MQDSAKYLIHADVEADGVVERSDVVGAVFGQTEGLLGDELDLRHLQQSSKVGRIDVQIRSREGQSHGELTIASGLDRVETAVLAAALETIERIGPCRARFRVTDIEDARSARRREVVERATDLLAAFEESVLTSEELVDEVRRAVRVEDITEYEGLPAGPHVESSDAIIVVEGRADVRQLLKYGIKNAIAIEGTNVPDAVAELTRSKTVTAFLDGDRGGDLILKELGQVGEVDAVAFAPAGQSVEDLSRSAVMTALREKVPYDAVAGTSDPHEAVAATDGSSRPAPPGGNVSEPAEPESPTSEPSGTAGAASEESPDTDPEPTAGQAAATVSVEEAEVESETSEEGAEVEEADTEETGVDEEADVEPVPETLAGHVEAVVGGQSGAVRLLDGDFEPIASGTAAEAFDLVETTEPAPTTVVLDGELTQRILDVAAQRGVEQIIARSDGEYVKQPTDVRVRLADQL